MKFGKVDHPELIDFTLPPDQEATKEVLKKGNSAISAYIGCAKWNKQDLKSFYPKGTKDELIYYASQFNSIELNATFYRIFPSEQYNKWYDKTPDDFKFFPKIVQNVSHLRRLNEESYPILQHYLEVTSNLKEKLGTVFLQLHSNFGPKNWDRVVRFVEKWPKTIPLAIEFRHKDWFLDPTISSALYALLEEHHIANIIVDTAGRRDLLHMRLTNTEAFIRYVGANHECDYKRLDDWIERIAEWVNTGLEHLHFFVHQNLEISSPLLTAYFIKKLNAKLDLNLKIPKNPNEPGLLLF